MRDSFGFRLRCCQRAGALGLLLCAIGTATLVQAADKTRQAEKKPAALLAGKQFDERLARPLDATWSNAPLATALGNLAHTTHLAIVLDRRIDPERELVLSVAGQPLAEVFRRLAEGQGLGVSFWDPVVYLGPPETAAALRTLAWLRRDELEGLPAPRRAALEASRAWEWNDLATPRELLGQLAREAHVKLEGLDQVPHDLWPARRLPPMAWIDRLTLVTIQFNLTFETGRDGQSVRLVPLPEKVTARRSYPAGRQPGQSAQVLTQQYPQAVVRVEGDQIVVDGSIEDLETVARTIANAGHKAPKKAAAGKQVYTLTVEKPVGELVEQLGERLGVEFQLDRPAIERAGISLETIVEVKVADVSLDELVAAVLRPAGLKGVRRGRVVTVVPDPAAGAKR